MASLDPASRCTILQHFPALAEDPDIAYGPAARPLLSMKLLATLPKFAAVAPSGTAVIRRAAA